MPQFVLDLLPLVTPVVFIGLTLFFGRELRNCLLMKGTKTYVTLALVFATGASAAIVGASGAYAYIQAPEWIQIILWPILPLTTLGVLTRYFANNIYKYWKESEGTGLEIAYAVLTGGSLITFFILLAFVLTR